MKYISFRLNDYSLRDEQKEALGVISKYLEQYFSNKANNKSCLICMPMGSGKTGVFSFLSRGFVNQKHPGVLVLSPRKKITQQIYNETFSNFFSKLDKTIPIEKLPKTGYLIQTDKESLRDSYENKVFFMTIQMLLVICSSSNRENINILRQLKNKIGLIIIDEGHYEPAHKWALCIREFANAAKIIFTATPYRNDFREFEVSPENIYFCSYHQALRQKYIRSVSLLDNSPNKVGETEFSEKVIEKYIKLKGDGFISGTSKLIIRCDNHVSIKKIAQEIDRLGVSFIALHEKFKGSNDLNYTNVVPENVEAHNSSVWIHQFKLMEGVDAPSFQFIACFERHLNTRAFIQEIGRGLRIDKNNSNEILFYMDNEGGASFSNWKSYLNFDYYLDKNKLLPFVNTEDIYQKIINLYPEFIYFFGGFKERFEPEKLSETSVILPLMCNVYILKDKDNDLILISQYVKEQLIKDDRAVYDIQHTSNSFCILHVGIYSNKYLPNYIFPEVNAEIIYLVKIDSRLYVYDKFKITRGILFDKALINKISIDSLRKLLSDDEKTKVNQVSLQNLNLGIYSIQRKIIHASNLKEIAISLDEYSYSCSNIRGYSFENNPLKENKREYVKRYIGFTTGKISQDTNCKYQLQEYNFWLNELDKKLFAELCQLSYFERFAHPIVPEADINPVNILLYFHDFEEEFEPVGNCDSEPDRRICSLITQDKFSIEVYGQQYEFQIQKHNNGYKLSCDKFNVNFRSIDGTNKIPISFFNKTQGFSIIFDNYSTIYAHGQYYEPEIKVGRNFKENQFDVLSLLYEKDFFREIESEKGKKGTKGEIVDDKIKWERGSLFRSIIDLNVGDLDTEEIEYLLCDDLGLEIADFILCMRSKVIFIHAKFGSKTTGLSASKLQDVCGQAIKNIFYLSPYNHIEPTGVAKKWGQHWTLAELSIPRLIQCQKDYNSAPKEIWTHIKKRIQDPDSTKEVWLVLGGIISKSKLSSSLRNKKGLRAEALQASMQLLSCAQSVNSVGAKLKIFCNT
ncbi:TPA: DEAD/DEAH box helicase family protein [Legionella pneumophila]|uniref:DEAD/DEAH box helicase n=1 Tax=Legionella pneumophila TaxID=446 RepID=UPI0013750E3D|nr:DEAD/DEAH box helicase family protein [Legionella pneumophila]HAT1658634.1 DEAD/DEAH box helicase family protein [Legionella pneumophila]